MKTIINKNTSKVLFATTDDNYIVAENEIAISELLTTSLIVPYFNQTTRVFYEGATTEEITIAETTQDELFTIQQELDGIALYHRHKERLRRRVLKGNMTLAESKTTRKVLRETHLYLKSGDFDIALDLASAITGQTAKVTAEITWLIGKMNNTLAK